MAKVIGPMLSFGGSGQIAKAAVYGNWKGQPYVRRYVVPSNPQSLAQTATRSVFAWASSVWKQAGPLLQAPWNRFAVGQVITGRNAFIGRAVVALRSEVDLANFIGSPGAKGGLAASTVAAADGTGAIDVTFTLPTAPTGWTLQAAVAAAIIDQDPATEDSYQSYAAEETSTPWTTVTIPSTPAGDYVVVGWLRWAKADGSIAYGPSLLDTVTVAP